MKNNNAVFLVGGPGSGKDFLLRTALKESGAIEIPLAKLITAIQTNQNLEEVNGGPLIVNGNADDGKSVLLSKAVLEAMGYQTACVFVYTDEAASKARSKITEEKRAEKYLFSSQNMHIYSDVFGESFFLFDNSADFVNVSEETQTQMVRWISELSDLVEGYFEKPVMGIRAPKVPNPVGGEPKGGHHVPVGYERVKKGSFNVLHKKPAPVANQGDTVADASGVHESSNGPCYVCGRKLGNKPPHKAYLEDDNHAEVWVGQECIKKVKDAGHHGMLTHVSPDGKRHGPRIFHNIEHAKNYAKGIKEDVDVLFEKEFPTIVDMIVQKKNIKGVSQGDKYKGGIAVPGNKATSREIVTSESNQEVKVLQTQAKGVKYSKNRPAKGAKPPGEPFDGRIGSVPSGGIGLTGYKVEEVKPKPLSEIRRK